MIAPRVALVIPCYNEAARLDVVAFAESLEQVCVEAVEAGEMTKDLAVLIGKDAPYLHTEEFLDALDRRLQARMS